MDKICFLKEKVVSENKLVEIDGLVYRAQEARGDDKIRVVLVPNNAASNAGTSTDRVLPVRDVCYGYLKYLVSKTKEDSSDAKADHAVKQTMTDIFLEGRRVKNRLTELRQALKKAKTDLGAETCRLTVYKNSNPRAPQTVIDNTTLRIAALGDEISAATAALPLVQTYAPIVFRNAEEVNSFFADEFQFVVGYSTLLKYAKYGVPRPFDVQRRGANRGRPTAISVTAEQDLAAVIRYAADNDARLSNVEIAELATKIRDAEHETRREAQTDPNAGPQPEQPPLSVAWIRDFHKRRRQRESGIPIDYSLSSAEYAASTATASTSLAAALPLARAAGRRPGGVILDMGESGPTPHYLKTAIVELARENEERQEDMGAIIDQKAAEHRHGNSDEKTELLEEIADLEEQLAEAKRQVEKCEKKIQREETDIRRCMLPAKRSLETERSMLDRVYRELEQNASEDVRNLVSAQVNTLARAARDEFGAMVAPLVGPFVTIRPVLTSTNPAARRMLNETIERAAAGNTNGKRKRIGGFGGV